MNPSPKIPNGVVCYVHLKRLKKRSRILLAIGRIATGMKEALTDIKGIGPKKAEQVLEVVEKEAGVPEEVRANLQEAMSYYENGEYEYAGKFLERAMEGL